MRDLYKMVLPLPFLFLAGCGAGDDRYAVPTGEQLSELEQAVGSVDWSKAEQRTVLLDEYSFAPPRIIFTKDQPYELTLKNDGKTGHSFVSPDFFAAVAVQGLIFSNGEVKMPILESVTLEAGESKTLVFVPLETGEFPLICEQFLHETFGMVGSIRIE